MNKTIIKTLTKHKTADLPYLLLLYMVYYTFYGGAARTAGRVDRHLFSLLPPLRRAQVFG